VIDEPLAIFAGLTWLMVLPRSRSLNASAMNRETSPRKNGFEAYLSFICERYLTTPKLNQVFTFRDDFARMPDLLWQHDEFDRSQWPDRNLCCHTVFWSIFRRRLLAQSHYEVWSGFRRMRFNYLLLPGRELVLVFSFSFDTKRHRNSFCLWFKRGTTQRDLESLITGSATVTRLGCGRAK